MALTILREAFADRPRKSADRTVAGMLKKAPADIRGRIKATEKAGAASHGAEGKASAQAAGDIQPAVPEAPTRLHRLEEALCLKCSPRTARITLSRRRSAAVRFHDRLQADLSEINEGAPGHSFRFRRP